MRLFGHIGALAILLASAAAFAQEAGTPVGAPPETFHHPDDAATDLPPPGLEEAANHFEAAHDMYQAPPPPAHDPVIEGIRRAYGEDFADPLRGDTTAPPPAPEDSLARQSLQAAAILLFICGLIIFSAYLARRFGQRTPLLAGPNLGKELGRVYLNPKAALHYVQSGDRVLVVGVTPTSMSLITEFDAATFEGGTAAPPRPLRPFQEQLRSADARLSRTNHAVDDEEIDALRGDIKRLQQYLQDSARENT